MAITINFITRVINVPKSFMTMISPTLYELDVNALRLALKDIEDDIGITYPDTHRHNTEVTLAGVTYARAVEIINGFTVTFEDGQYAVRCVGANHNLSDVKNLNQVSLIIGNSAGLQTVNTGGGVGTVAEVADAVWNAIAANYLTPGSTGEKLAAAGSAGDPWSTLLASYNTEGTAGKIVKDIALAEENILAEVGNISVATSAINAVATGSILAAGTVTSGTYTSTFTPDGNYHTITSTASGIDIEYRFDIGLNSAPSSFTLYGFSLPKNHVVNVQAWNYTTLSWESAGQIVGSNEPSTFSGTLFLHNTGTLPGEIGDVRIRLHTTQTGTTINIDQLFVSYATMMRREGYATHVGAGTTNTTIVIGPDASPVNNFYVPSLLHVDHGTGAGQYAKVIGYNGSTKTLTVELPMAVTLDTTSYVVLQPWANATITNTSLVAIGDQVRTELEPELSRVMQIPTTGTGLTPTQETMLLEMFQILGLDPSKPLVVTQTSRSVVGTTIDQNISTSPTETIVTRV